MCCIPQSTECCNTLKNVTNFTEKFVKGKKVPSLSLLCLFFSDDKEDNYESSNLNDTQTLRKEGIEQYCLNSRNKKAKFERVILVTNPDKTLAYCHVPKAASSAWMLIFSQMNKLQSKSVLWEENFPPGKPFFLLHK
jgi:hypothetical protein